MNAFHRSLCLLGVLQVLAMPAPATAASVYTAAGELMLPAPISVADVAAVSATCALSNGTAVPQSGGIHQVDTERDGAKRGGKGGQSSFPAPVVFPGG